MSLPLVAVVGRPNVGKSTLVNRVVGRREAIVEEKPGVTRDRKMVEAEWCGRRFNLVDTGGWQQPGSGSSSTVRLDAQVSREAEKAISSADVILFVVDTTVGITTEDESVANLLRRAGRPVVVVANKVDDSAREVDVWVFAKLGLGDPMAVSALHGRLSGDLLDAVVAALPAEAVDEAPAAGADDRSTPSVVIAGRPNAGKSTLFNRLIGDDRSIVSDLPGTTRDTVDTIVVTENGPWRFIDTAGMRRRTHMAEGAEYYSMVRALQAIDRADAALLMIDAADGVTHQDQRLAERIDAAGNAIVVVMNKWELLSAQARSTASIDVADRLGFLGYSPVLKVSAQSGKGVSKILPALAEAIEAYHRRVPTRELNQVVQAAQAAHPARNARVLYATQGTTDPPTFVMFVDKTLTPGYLRYLERKIREHFDFGPTPIKFRVRKRA